MSHPKTVTIVFYAQPDKVYTLAEFTSAELERVFAESGLTRAQSDFIFYEDGVECGMGDLRSAE